MWHLFYYVLLLSTSHSIEFLFTACSQTVLLRTSAGGSSGVGAQGHRGGVWDAQRLRGCTEVAQELRASNASLHAKSTLADGRVRRLTSSIYY
jgi:hypothetical protein